MEEVDDFRKKFEKKAEDTKGKLSDITSLVTGHAVFKAKIAEGNRITVPKPEMEALDLDQGDLVQVSLRPLEKGEK